MGDIAVRLFRFGRSSMKAAVDSTNTGVRLRSTSVTAVSAASGMPLILLRNSRA